MTRAIPLLPPPPALSVGEFAPWFTAPTPLNPNFYFSTVAGRYVLLGFLPSDDAGRRRAMNAFDSERARFDDLQLTAFMVIRDAPSIERVRNQLPGLRWLLDGDGAVSRLFGALAPDGTERPFWLLLDPSLRVLASAPMDGAAAMMHRVAGLPAVAAHAGVPLCAPVLVAPRIFEPELCRQLISLYEDQGGEVSGVMRDIDGRTVGVVDGHKRRRDASIGDPELRAALRSRLRKRLLPEIEKAFQFTATRVERYIVACYDAADGGYFRPHRDNETLGTAHRKFAVSINLNAEAFDGGDLRFPEFGPRTYRPPTGGAVVFSCSLQHEATPVTRGRRYAFLPFLYDEAGARLRDANLANVGAL
jgi:peroxiredoxin